MNGSLLRAIAITATILSSRDALASFVLQDSAAWGTGAIVYDTSTGLDWLRPRLTSGQSYNQVSSLLGTPAFQGFGYASTSQLQTLASGFGVLVPTSSPSLTATPPDAGLASAYDSFFTYFGGSGGISGPGDCLFGGPDCFYFLSVAGISGAVDSSQLPNAWHYTATFAATFPYPATGLGPASTVSSTIGGVGGFGPSQRDVAISQNGSWLVRTHIEEVPAVPLPPAAWLLLSGLSGLFAFFRNRATPVTSD